MLKQPNSSIAQREKAEQIAASALGFIAADEDRLANFFAMTGLSPEDIRKSLAQPGFLGSILQHLLSDESTAAAFATENDLSPEDLMRAAHHLGLDWG